MKTKSKKDQHKKINEIRKRERKKKGENQKYKNG